MQALPCPLLESSRTGGRGWYRRGDRRKRLNRDPSWPASDAEVALEQLRARLDLLRRPLVRDMSVVDDVDAARQREGRGEVLLDQQDGLSGRGQLAADPHELAHDERRQRSEERRVGKECRSRGAPDQEKDKQEQHGSEQTKQGGRRC